MLNRFIYICFFFAALQLFSCKKDDIEPPLDRTAVPRTIGQFIQNNYNFTFLRAALDKTGLMDSLNLPNAGTFFAPDNAAFNKSGVFSIAEIDGMNTDSLRRQLKNYMLADRFFISEFPKQMGNTYISKAGYTLYISQAPNTTDYRGAEFTQTCINGVPVKDQIGISRNIALVNGVIHVPLRLINYTPGTVQDYLAADKNLTIFVEAMKRFDFWDDLKTAKPITVFAPKNKAFEDLGITLDSMKRINPNQFDPLVFSLYHFNLSAKHIFSSDGWLIGGRLYREQGLRIGDYSFLPNYGYNSYNSSEGWDITLLKRVGEEGWENNPYGPLETNYDNRYYDDYFEPGPNDNVFVPNADHVTENGIVHVIEDVLFNPAFFKK